MKLKTGLLTILVLTLLLNITTPFLSKSASASPTTYVKILDAVEGDTALTYTNTMPPPTVPNYPLGYVLVNVTVFDVSELAAWQLNVTWDSDLLEIAKSADMIIPSDNVFDGYPDPVGLTIVPGSVYWMVGIKYGAPFTNVTIPTQGTLCQIKFNVTKTPTEGETLSCDIHIVTKGEHVICTKLVNPSAIEISYTSEDGYYEYEWPPPPPPPSEGAAFWVRPSEIINSSILPPQSIQLNITMKNVTDMYGYGFSLGYDSSILYCTSLAVLDVLGETSYIPEFSVDNVQGIIEVNVTYIPPATPITTELEVTLVTVVFRVAGLGATPLVLYNTSLVDSLGRPIPHVTHDGFFANIISDLALTSVVPYANWVYEGHPLKINVTVKNEGEITETSITVNAYYDSNLLGNATIGSLDPDENTTLTFTWDTETLSPCNNYTISAEVVPVPYEMDLSDNTYVYGEVKVKLYGDLNGDGLVDVQDVQLVKNAIPSYPGIPKWDPRADLNMDAVVDVMDLQLVKRNVGEVC